MALLNLIARLGLDNSGFDTSLKDAEKTANTFANKFQRSIVGTVGKFFTLGFAINFVQDKIRALEGAGETMEIPTGTLSEAIQEQEALIRGSEKRLSLKKELEKLDSEIFKVADQRFLKELSEEDRRTELIRRRIALVQILKTVQMPPVKAKEIQLETEKLLSQIQAIDVGLDKPTKPEFQTRNIAEAVRDPLARIGGFTGGADVKIITIQERIAKATEDTASNTAGNSVRYR